MADVSPLFTERWRSGKHIGPAQPSALVQIRKGRFMRSFNSWTAGEVNAIMPGNSRHAPWQATWTPLESYRTIPNVEEIKTDQSFDQKGMTSGTVVLENVVFANTEGLLGLFLLIDRGYLSPWRGYTGGGRRGIVDDPANDWSMRLVQAAQITVHQGYGDAMTKTFTGLIDQVDLTSHPDKITVTVRDFGQTLTDQHLFGYAKDKALAHRPTVFADRLAADDEERKGGGAKASSAERNHPAGFVTDKNSSAWISDDASTPAWTEWIEVRLPAGRYESFVIEPAYPNMAAYLSVYARGSDVKVDNVDHGEGWIGVGNGNVPGANGGVPWLKHISSVANKEREYAIGHKLELGDDSVLRIHFRNLREARSGGDTVYRAGARTLQGLRRKRKQEAKDRRWVLVEDAADVVRVILRWAGFKEWYVEDTGVRLKNEITFHQGDFLYTPIEKLLEMVNFVFYVDDPTSDDLSIGVPVFRHIRVLDSPGRGVEEVRDDQILTGVQVKFDRSQLRYIIRVRGQRAEGLGVTRGEDTVARWEAAYKPKWTRDERLAGVIRHENHYDNNLQTQKEVDVQARQIALAGALRSATGIFECPANPGLPMDGQVGVRDRATGLNTRIWTAQRSTEMTLGERTSWKMTIGGTLIDTPDVQDAINELKDAVGVFEPNMAEPYAIGGTVQRG